MATLATPARTTSAAAAAVLEHVARDRKVTIALPDDAGWLREITPRYAQLLKGMKDRSSLYWLTTGRYVVAPRASEMIEQAAPTELLVDLLMRGRSPYYLGFLTALIDHQLTDLHSTTLYVATPQEGTRGDTGLTLEGTNTEVKFARFSAARWPAADQLERRRVLPGMREFAWRSTLERTLVDTLVRPDLSGGIETVVTAWARAARDRHVRWEMVWEIAQAFGLSGRRRVAFMLGELGYGYLVEDALEDLRRTRTVTLFDRTDGFRLASSKKERDPRTRITLNVPRSYLRGWLGAAAYE